MEILSLVFLAFSLIVPLAIVITIIYFFTNLSKKKDGVKISAKTFFQIYLYLISFITLSVAIIGGSIAIRSAISFPFGIDFSYTLYKANDFVQAPSYDTYATRENLEECYDGEPILINNAEYCANYTQRTKDLVNGITIFISMAILFLIHQFTIKRIDKKEKAIWIPKVYTFASLILYSIIGIVAIPTSIYQLTNFFVFASETTTYSTSEAPAMALAITILVVPLWIFFLKQTANIKEEKAEV